MFYPRSRYTKSRSHIGDYAEVLRSRNGGGTAEVLRRQNGGGAGEVRNTGKVVRTEPPKKVEIEGCRNDE